MRLLTDRYPEKIAIAFNPATRSHEAPTVYVVANDGTMWWRASGFEWQRLPDLPQPSTP